MDSDDESTVVDYDGHPTSSSYQAQYRGGGGGYEDLIARTGDGMVAGGGAPPMAGGKVAALEQEVKRLREALSATSQGTAEANYLTQLKRNRELNVKLESERTRVQKLQGQIVALEREKFENESQSKKGVLLPSQKSPSKAGGSVSAFSEEEDLAKQLSEWKERCDRQGRQMATVRKQNDDLKREVARMKKVVAHEIGEDTMEKALASMPDDDVASVSGQTTKSTATTTAGGGGGGGGASTSTGWRGRAQQISILKSKVKELERWKSESQCGTTVADPNDLGSPDDVTVSGSVAPSVLGGPPRSVGTYRSAGGTTNRDHEDVHRMNIAQKEQNRKMEARELKQALAQKDQEIEKERTKADSLTARLQILERDNQHLKVCMARVVEKTENDDRLIQTYKDQLEAKNVEIRRVATAAGGPRVTGGGGGGPPAGAPSYPNREHEVAELKGVVAQLQTALQEARSSAASQKNGGGGEDAALKEIAALIAMDPDSALGKALSLIDLQRHSLSAFNAQLQSYETRMTDLLQSNAGSAVAAATREENLNLKERLKDLSDMMEKEIQLHKQLAMSTAPARSPVTPVTPVSAVAPPASVGAGRRSDVNSAPSRGQQPIAGRRSSRPPTAGSDDSSTPPTPNTNAFSTNGEPSSSDGGAETDARMQAMQSELQGMKQQYAELRRAYNAQQMSTNRVKSGSQTQVS